MICAMKDTYFDKWRRKKCAPDKGRCDHKDPEPGNKAHVAVINGITYDILSVSLFPLNLWILFVCFLVNMSYEYVLLFMIVLKLLEIRLKT